MGFNQVFVIFWLSAIPSGKQSKTFVPGGASEAHRSALAKRPCYSENPLPKGIPLHRYINEDYSLGPNNNHKIARRNIAGSSQSIICTRCRGVGTARRTPFHQTRIRSLMAHGK